MEQFISAEPAGVTEATTVTKPTTAAQTAIGAQGQLDFVTLVKMEHDQVRQCYEQFQATKDPETKQRLCWTIIRLLSMHGAKEEEVLYPVIRDKEGDTKADELLREHQELKLIMNDLNDMKAGDPGFDQKVSDLMQVMLHHINDEENITFPRIMALPGVDPVALGKKFLAAESHAPTRPHPMAPNKPPLNIAANMSAAPLDALADQARFGGNPPQSVTSVLATKM